MISIFKKKKSPTWKSLIAEIKGGDIDCGYWQYAERATEIFYKVNHEFPLLLKYQRDDCENILAMETLEKEFGMTDQNCMSHSNFGDREGDIKYNEVRLMLIERDCYILFSYLAGGLGFLIFYSSNTSKELLEKIKQIIKASENKAKHSISLVSRQAGELALEEYNIGFPKGDLKANYNEDFEEVDKIIRRSLELKDGKGLVLLHGLPGTGKTTYIRHLISTLKKKVIFLPLEFAEAIGTPDGISFLSHFPNSILVIEDAEHILKQRTGERRGTVASTLLNLNDGLLGDCLRIQVICTFNAPLASIDEAFLRKGRLIARYEFKELEEERCRALFKELDITEDITGKMVLSDIYNIQNKDFKEGVVRTKIGFK